MEGINFASQDYLSLASHPAIERAAVRALRELGPHSAGSPVLVGNTQLSLELENEIADFLQYEHVVLFPTGWAAGFGTIVGLVRPKDHVVIDTLAHACLHEGVHAATQNIVRHDHLSIDAVGGALDDIRSRDERNGILVITEGLFSMDSDSPRVQELQALCHQYDATLMVDVAHDLGSLGPGGTGVLGLQRMLGKVDLVMGSFSKTFASNGGFLATHSRAVKEFVKYYGGPHIFSNALSPVQAGIVLAALKIVRSEEGDHLRAACMKAITRLRTEFEARDLRCLGDPSPIVPVMVGAEAVARVASRYLADAGVATNLVEFPAVAVGKARFRMQVMAKHTETQAAVAARAFSEAVARATIELAERKVGLQRLRATE